MLNLKFWIYLDLDLTLAIYLSLFSWPHKAFSLAGRKEGNKLSKSEYSTCYGSIKELGLNVKEYLGTFIYTYIHMERSKYIIYNYD